MSGVPQNLIDDFNAVLGSVNDNCMEMQTRAYQQGKAEGQAEIDRLKTCILLAQEVAAEWLRDSSDFYGGTLRDQMNDLDAVAVGTTTPDEYRVRWWLGKPDAKEGGEGE